MASMHTANLTCSCGAKFSLTALYPYSDVAEEARQWASSHQHSEPLPAAPIELVSSPRIMISGPQSRRARLIHRLRDRRR